MRILMLLMALLLVSGCTAQTRYTWSGYDDKLFNYYKNPADADKYMEGLHEVVQAAEASGKIPPGIYAEYGYALYERGRSGDASLWFAKERDKWPESKVLMEKMIRLAGSRSKSDEGKSGAAEQGVMPESSKEKTP